mgnify:CR=1 FL=1
MTQPKKKNKKERRRLDDQLLSPAIICNCKLWCTNLRANISTIFRIIDLEFPTPYFIYLFFFWFGEVRRFPSTHLIRRPYLTQFEKSCKKIFGPIVEIWSKQRNKSTENYVEPGIRNFQLVNQFLLTCRRRYQLDLGFWVG